MQYQLETIPLWEAYRAETECPLCYLHDKAEKSSVEYYLGSSVMAPEIRVKVNQKGFCPVHFHKLLESRGHKHGLGLLTHTHLQNLNQGFDTMWTDLKSAINKVQAKRVPFSRKKNPLINKMERYMPRLLEKEQECLICDDVAELMNRYAFTIVYQWQKDSEFAQTYRQSRGFCLSHLPLVFSMAQGYLKGKKLAAFTEDTMDLQKAALHRLESEILWYTQKFDPQNDEKPWGTSRDALGRSIQKLTGRPAEEE